MKVRHGYKQTEVGIIPKEWEVKPLEQVFTLKHGFAFSSENFSKSGPIVLTPGNFSLEGGLYFEDRNTIRYSGGYSPKTTFSRGDLLIVMTDLTPNCNLLGKPAFVETDELVLHNQRIGKVVVKDKSVHVPFLFYSLLSRTYLNHIRAQAVGSTVRHTSSRSIYSAQLAWPPLTEQRAITAALNDVNALLGGLEQLIAKKRDLKQATMQQLLTGQTRLPGFSGEWMVKLFDDVLLRLNVKVNQIQTAEYQSTGIYPVVDQGKATIVGFSDLADRRLQCPEGGVIVFGDHTCLVKFIDFDFLVGADGTQVIRGRAGQCTRFHFYQLQYRGIEPTGYNRHFKFLKEREFLVPSLLEQTAIAMMLADMDAELTALEARRDKTRALKQTMMQELLTGKTRLVPNGDTACMSSPVPNAVLRAA